MRQIHLFLRHILFWGVLLCLILLAYAVLRQRPQDLPWTKIDLDQPIGLFTGRKLAALTGERAQCLALLEQAGVSYSAMEPGGSGQCVYDDAVRLKAERGALAYAPAAVAPHE